MKKILILLTLISIIGISTFGCGTNEVMEKESVSVETNLGGEYGVIDETMTDETMRDDTATDVEVNDEEVIILNGVEIDEETTEEALVNQIDTEVKQDIAFEIVDSQEEVKKDDSTKKDKNKDEGKKTEVKSQTDKSKEKSSASKEEKRENDIKTVDESVEKNVTDKVIEDSTIELTLEDKNKNQYFNDVPDLLLNGVSIDPYLIKFNDNHLTVEAFVINGFEYSVYNIDVHELKITNENDEVISMASSFGVLENAIIAPLSYIKWTFNFYNDTIVKTDDDFNSIKCYSKVYYQY